jgi:hypothetical protein
MITRHCIQALRDVLQELSRRASKVSRSPSGMKKLLQAITAPDSIEKFLQVKEQLYMKLAALESLEGLPQSLRLTVNAVRESFAEVGMFEDVR